MATIGLYAVQEVAALFAHRLVPDPDIYANSIGSERTRIEVCCSEMRNANKSA